MTDKTAQSADGIRVSMQATAGGSFTQVQVRAAWTAEARDAHSSDYWGRVTDGMPRRAAFSGVKTDTVKAKDAPLGVQLWPTTSPGHAPNFTLATVIRQLGSNGREYVIWQYENGNTRMFLPDEDVAVQIVGAER